MSVETSNEAVDFDITGTLLFHSDDLLDHEEGEIIESDHDSLSVPEEKLKRKVYRVYHIVCKLLRILTDASYQNFDRKRRRKLAKEYRAKELSDIHDAIEEESLLKANKLIQALYGQPNVNVYVKKRDTEYLAQLLSIEEEGIEPLSPNDDRFQALKKETTWITKPGVHLVFDETTKAFVFGCKIEPYSSMTESRFNEVKFVLSTIMDYTTAVNNITINSSQKPHGIEHKKKSSERKRFGKMFGAGWHNSMEEGKTIVAYAPKSNIHSINIYEDCIKKFPKVAQFYRDGLLGLFPGGGKKIDEFSMSEKIPSFAALNLDGDSSERPFANSLTITRDDFSNYQHMDADEIDVAYGLWWAGKKEFVKNGVRYVLDPKIDHQAIKGGSFLVGSYGVGVDFEKSNGLISLYWRGKFDFHSTMASTSPEHATRFGTSIQLTSKGTSAVNRFWTNSARQSTVTTPLDRIQVGRERIQRKA
ncbi:hypothetical protein H2248_005594 [Termitomyces sp. 'cryptogamus']|nr:hypothetical protein H2248_005594 [Termitomyces sp. 'cryptogamus']